MKPIPIHDESVPIVCTIGAEEIPERIALTEHLRQNLVRIERTEHGLLLTFPDRPEIEADLHQFAIDEKRCCQFWGFAVDRRTSALTLRWDGPPASGELLDRLLAYFEGDEPITAISGVF